MTSANPKHVKGLVLLCLFAGLVLRLLQAFDHTHFCPLIDDSFYSFSIARNIAQGKGVTYAGQPTNGFQPLSVFLSVPAYVVTGSHDALAVKLMLALFGLVNLATGYFFFRYLRAAGAPAAGVFMLVWWTLSPYVGGHGLNGLETGLTTFFMATSVWYYTERMRNEAALKPRAVVTLGVLLGLGVLSRVDMGFWAVAVAADYVLMARVFTFAKRVQRIIVVAAVAALICSPWFIYNQVAFGSLLPTSGSGVRFISIAFGYNYWGRTGAYFPVDAIPVSFYLGSFSAAVTDILHAIVVPLVVVTRQGLLVLLLIAAWMGRKTIFGWLRENSFLVVYPVFILVAYCTYVFGQWFYPRYFYGVVAVCMVLISRFAQLAWTHVPVLHRHAALLLAVFAILVGGCSWNSVVQSALRGEISNDAYAEHLIPRAMIEGVVPEGERVGGFQSGALEYHCPEWDVVNLDGVVNDQALHAMEDKRMDVYMRDKEINWMLDLDWIIDALYVRCSSMKDPLDEWVEVKRAGKMVLYHRKDPR